MIELAIATRTAPADWWGEPLEVLETAKVVLARNARDARRRR